MVLNRAWGLSEVGAPNGTVRALLCWVSGNGNEDITL